MGSVPGCTMSEKNVMGGSAEDPPIEHVSSATSSGPVTTQIDDVERAVAEHTLPDELAELADRYERQVGIRDRFVWKWFHLLNPHFKLSAVDTEHTAKVQDDKTFLTFYITLIDDLLETRNDTATFEAAAALPFADSAHIRQDNVDSSYLEITADVWETVEERLLNAPAYERFAPIFEFDLRQVINAIRYSGVVTEQPRMGNLTEAYAYGSHNMVMFPYAWIDLMHSSTFDMDELPTVRTMLWHAQRLARIGNWVSTWERELEEHDFGSGIVIHALENGLVSADDLQEAADASNKDDLDEIAAKIDREGIEEFFLDEWRWHYQKVARIPALESVDLDEFLRGIETVLQFHLGSRGLK